VKKDIRKERANERKMLFATGGGPLDPKGRSLQPLEEELSAATSLSATGLPSAFDNDGDGNGKSMSKLNRH
jgi:hypothetical protein